MYYFTQTHTHGPVMLSQVVNSTLYLGQSSTQPYATPTPAQPPLNDSQFSGSGYANGSYVGGFLAPPTSPPPGLSRQPQPPQQQPQQRARTPQGFPLSPTTFLNSEGKGEKPVGGVNPNFSEMPGTNYPMKNESSFEGVGFPPSQQDLYSSFPQQQMVPPQGYGAMNRTDMTSPEANYGVPMKDETSIGTVGQFLNQFLSNPLNPSQVANQPIPNSSQCYEQSGGNHAQQQQQQGLPSSSMFQFPTSPLQQRPQFESPPVGSLPSLLQQPPPQSSDDSTSQPPSMFRVSSAGNLGTVSTESPPAPARPPLSRGKSEPIRHLQQQVKFLSQENERQMMEIEKQQSIAEQQYMAVLQQVAEQQASGKTSQHQRDVLKSVLSDPGLVNLLRDILLSNPPPSSVGDGEEGQQRSCLQPLSITPTKMSSDSGAHVSSTPSPLISPSQTSQVTLMPRDNCDVMMM